MGGLRDEEKRMCLEGNSKMGLFGSVKHCGTCIIITCGQSGLSSLHNVLVVFEDCQHASFRHPNVGEVESLGHVFQECTVEDFQGTCKNIIKCKQGYNIILLFP